MLWCKCHGVLPDMATPTHPLQNQQENTVLPNRLMFSKPTPRRNNEYIGHRHLIAVTDVFCLPRHIRIDFGAHHGGRGDIVIGRHGLHDAAIHRNLYGRFGRLYFEILPNFLVGRFVWPIDGGLRRGNQHFQLDHAKTRPQTRHLNRGDGLRHFDLWRRVFVCGGVCDLSDCQIHVSGR